ncbi:MAG: methylated-DNA--[protein]-cysteine S-methyltransferase [Paucibacter sp.]|nr:methylated-DNA--[protein]-cysteine S-methyltransferase [Roseateles sp.]
MSAFFHCYDTALGRCGIAWDESDRVIGSQLPEATDGETRDRMRARFPAAREINEAAALPGFVLTAMLGVRRLLAGETADLNELLAVPLADEHLPPFQREVLALTRRIPIGGSLEYGEVARQLGQPDAARSVGQAEGHNPFAPIVPCHRVVAAVVGQGGFSAHGGLKTKARLLAIEARAAGRPLPEQADLF